MMTLLFLLLVIGIFGLSLVVFRRTYLRNKIRQRLQFGINSAEEESDVDLSAGDYGLTGSARFFYYLSDFLSTKLGYVMLFGIGALLATGTSLILDKTIQNIFTTAALGGALLFLVVVYILRLHKIKRLNLIKYELPNALEMIAAIMESGLGYEASLRHVIKEANVKHPLYFDLAIMSEAMQRGRRRNEALRLWANRTNESSVADVVAGMIQADQTGASLGAVLKHHANTLMKENEAFLMRRAERLPVRMLLPMLLMILPSVFIVAAGPSVLRIFQIFKALMENA